jgi:hypothetical protein
MLDVIKLELSGSGPMLFCAPHDDPLPLKRLELHNLGASHMLAHNLQVRAITHTAASPRGRG